MEERRWTLLVAGQELGPIYPLTADLLPADGARIEVQLVRLHPETGKRFMDTTKTVLGTYLGDRGIHTSGACIADEDGRPYRMGDRTSLADIVARWRPLRVKASESAQG